MTVEINSFVKFLGDQIPPDDGRDWSIELATHLALAQYALSKLVESGHKVKVNNRELVGPPLRQAWAETLYIRKNLPAAVLSGDVYRSVTLTKYGRVLRGSDHAAAAYRRPDGNSGSKGTHE